MLINDEVLISARIKRQGHLNVRKCVHSIEQFQRLLIFQCNILGYFGFDSYKKMFTQNIKHNLQGHFQFKSFDSRVPLCDKISALIVWIDMQEERETCLMVEEIPLS